uniref:beta-N-acetylhexosaminidase n=1 Tax=Thaumasiovibrio occultus TaxID=1891184 RepID=UPI000B35CC3F|nr:beta-N-acetylhexosaminidase [Thaumasiovibrio occultus]
MKPSTALNLMPYPKQLEICEGCVEITQNFTVFVVGDPAPSNASDALNERQGDGLSELLTGAATRFIRRLERQTGLSLWQWQAASAQEASLVLKVDGADFGNALPHLAMDESYRITVVAGQIVLAAPSPFGLLHGLETLLQLVVLGARGYEIPAVTISDSPRFRWRGVSFDTSRRFIEFDVLLRQIDAMASAKLNVFHWHFWDDQGIRIAFESWPRLWQATADGRYYSKDQVRTLVEYARVRGIRVIPEVSLPGHASAVAHAYPELISADQTYPQQREWGVFPPLMDPLNPKLYAMLGDIFDEVVALFPDEYIHIGGDEPNYIQWLESEKHQSFIKENQLDGVRGLQSYLNAKVEKMLAARQRKMIGWDEVWHKDLPTSIVIQSWQGHDSLGRAAKQGYCGILSTGFYFDQPQPTSYHYRNDPVPHPRPIDDRLKANESFVTYQWEKRRTKEGPRKGTLTIISSPQGVRAFTDYENQSRRALEVEEYVPGQRFVGHYDNFMSVTEFNLSLDAHGLTAGSYQRIGNVRWPTTGVLLAFSERGDVIPPPTAGYPAILSEEEETKILGGEITIWMENKDSDTVEQYLWPRSYAVAERFWSPAALRDEQSLYQRLQAIDMWSEISVGLRHHANARLLLKRIASDYECLVQLGKYTEPAQYYARNWEKWIATQPPGGHYNQHERLNRFVDALPVESMAVYEMGQLITSLEETMLRDAQSGEPCSSGEVKRTLDTLTAHYQCAHQAAQASAEAFAAHHPAGVTLANATAAVSQLGLALLERLSAVSSLRDQPPIDQSTIVQPAISQQRIAEYQNQLAASSIIYDEAIVALVRPTEQLLALLSKRSV